MAQKRYNQQSFYIEVGENRTLGFYCWSTSTRSGFCHTVWCMDTDQTSKTSYYNRSWESYDYQSTLRKAFNKLPKAEREICQAWDVAHEEEVCHRCDQMAKAFESAYNAAPQSIKDTLANSDIELRSESDVKAVTAMLNLATLMAE